VVSACGSCFDWVCSAYREYTAELPYLACPRSPLGRPMAAARPSALQVIGPYRASDRWISYPSRRPP
jgi:hypothetical protein